MTAVIRMLARRNWQWLARKAGQAYVSGPELDDAVRNSRQLSSLGVASTICYWNLPEDSPQQVANACIEAAGALAQEKIDGYLSLKLPPLKGDQEQLERILTEAAHRDLLVHFDAHGPDSADAAFAAIARSVGNHPRLGCTLPGRWPRSCRDAEMAIERRLHVRVVKGQWPDPQHPEVDPADGFLRVIEVLAGRAQSVAVATHDTRLAVQALHRLQDGGTECVLELLYGLPIAPSLRLAAELGVSVRIYIPFGYGWLPYTLGQARRNPRMLWWILRDYLAGGSFPGSTGQSGKIRESHL